MILGETISSIEKNKHYKSGNYNAGIVKLQCFVNEYCPFDRTDYVEHNLLFNDETIQLAPQSIRDKYGWISGELGIFLKPKYIYHSNFLYISKKEEDTSQSSSPLGSAPAGTVLGRELVGSDQYLKIISEARRKDPAKFEEYSWDVTHHPFQGNKTILTTSDYFSSSIAEDKKDPQRWSAARLNSVVKKNDLTEMEDSNVIYNFQVAATIPTSSTTLNPGTHWRVRKKTDIFRGEDFFIEIIRGSLGFDIRNQSKEISFSGPLENSYKFLDVHNSSTNSNNQRYNRALVSDDKSKDLFDLTSQPYVILELQGGFNWYYFVILTLKAPPRFIKVIDQLSYYVSEYSLKEVGELFKRSEKLKIAVRSHLGKIVITFNDDNNAPWVIENDATERENADSFDFNKDNPPKVFCVPRCRPVIWCGNMPGGFTFSPIQYENNAVLDLPFLTKQEISGAPVNGKIQAAEKFVMPSNARAVFSIRDSGIAKVATPTKPGQFVGEGGVNQSGKKPFYICDAQETQEYSTSLSSTIKINNSPYFLDFPDFIKELTPNINEIDEEGQTISITYRASLKMFVGGYEREGQYEKFYLKVDLDSGWHKFSNSKGEYALENCKTPILTNVRLTNKSSDSDAWEPRSSVDNVDLSDYILTYNDNWTSQDFHTMEHSADIDFLITRGGKNAGQPNIEALQNKAFYVQILAGYAACNYSLMGDQRSISDGPYRDGCATKQSAGFFKLMTGICYGGSITESAGERHMRCKVYDYSKIMQDMLIFNSPFFDGVRDINAVYELVKMCGFGEREYKPAQLIFQAVNVEDEWGGGVAPDGRFIPVSKVYALPYNYDQYRGDPAFRFADGSTTWEALQKIAVRSGKVIFFDSNGLLHYESFPLANLLYGANDNENGGGGGDVESTWFFTANPSGYGQLVFDKIERELVVEDVYNNIHVMTTTPNRELIIADEINKASLTNPNSEGFLGYRKTFLQVDGIFGSAVAIVQYARHLTKFFRPPVVYKLNTFGLPMRPFDVAEIDGQRIIVLNVSHKIDARENKWTMDVEGEWFFGQQSKPDT